MCIIVGFSGASGVVMGCELLKVMSTVGGEIHLVMTEVSIRTLFCETSFEKYGNFDRRFARLPGI